MKKEYAIYPFEYMRITQRHDEENHLAHWQPTANYSDKPIDEACEDGGRGYFVPKNDYKVVEKLGNQTNGYSIRLETTNKVYIPYQDTPVILEPTLTHLNYDDWSKLSKGQIIKAGQKLIREGTSGLAKGKHLHCTFNIGKYYFMKENSNKKWVFCYEKSLTPVEAFYVDSSVKILDSKGYAFKEVPIERVGTPVLRNTKENQVEVVADNLRARNKPNGAILGYINKGIYNILERVINGEYEWFKVENDVWIAYSENWSKLYEKEIETTPPTEPPTEINTETPTQPIEEQPVEESPITKIIKKIISLLKRIFR